MYCVCKKPTFNDIHICCSGDTPSIYMHWQKPTVMATPLFVRISYFTQSFLFYPVSYADRKVFMCLLVQKKGPVSSIPTNRQQPGPMLHGEVALWSPANVA